MKLSELSCVRKKREAKCFALRRKLKMSEKTIVSTVEVWLPLCKDYVNINTHDFLIRSFCFIESET